MAKFKYVHTVELVVDDVSVREGEEIVFVYEGERVSGKVITIDERHDYLIFRVDEIGYPVKVFKIGKMEKVGYVYYD